MPTIAIQLNENLVNGVIELMGADADPSIFGDKTYAVVKTVTPTQFTFEFLTQDEICEAAAKDPEMEIISI